MSQLTLQLQPSLVDRFPTFRSYIAHRSTQVHKLLKVQAADMDMAVSTLRRKLNPAEGDTQRFNLDDFEAWLESTGDAQAAVEYLCAKYLDSDSNRQIRMVANAERLLQELAAVIPTLKSSTERTQP